MAREFVIGVLAILCAALVFSFPLAWLWNVSFVPAINVLNPVSWLQMWGMLVFFVVVTFKPTK